MIRALLYSFFPSLFTKPARLAAMKAKWNDDSLLSDMTGSFYTTTGFGDHFGELRKFDLKSKVWVTIPDIKCRHGVEDVQGQLLVAFSDDIDANMSDRPIGADIYKLPETVPYLTIPGDYLAASLSPTGEFLALVEDFGQMIESNPAPSDKTEGQPRKRAPQSIQPKQQKQFTVHGYRGRIRVYRTSSGELIRSYDDYVVRGISWSPDSKRLAFTTLRDKGIYDFSATFPDNEEIAVTVPGSDDPTRIGVLDIESGAATELVDGHHPDWSVDGKSILFDAGSGVVSVYSFDTFSSRKTGAIDEHARRFMWLSDQRRIACYISMRGRPPGQGGILIFDSHEPSRRYMLDIDAYWGYGYSAK